MIRRRAGVRIAAVGMALSAWAGCGNGRGRPLSAEGRPARPADVRPSAGRAEALSAFEKAAARVFGGDEGIHSPAVVRKFEESWEKEIGPLLGAERLGAYRERYALDPDADGAGGRRRRPAKRVPVAVREALLAKLKGAFEPEWGVAEGDLPRLREALSEAFQAATGRRLPSGEPRPAAGGSVAAVPVPAGPPGAAAPAAGGAIDPSVDRGPADGFAREATGGGSAPWRVVPPKVDAISAALRQGGNIRVQKGDVEAPYHAIVVPADSTLDGGGCTFWFPGSGHNGKGVTPSGNNIVLRNFRVRNAGDNVCFGSASHSSSVVLCENVSSTGSGDDGMSPAYKCRDITIRWSFVGGCTRAVFMKYGPRDITIHHTILSHYWMRGPLASGDSVRLDFRNNLVQHWSMWGSRVAKGAAGNFVGCVWRMGGFEHSGAKADTAPYGADGVSRIYAAGNVNEGCSPRTSGFSPSPVVDAPPVPTEDARTALAKVLDDRAGAGCMPRDTLDKAYLEWKEPWTPAPQDKTVTHGLAIPGSRLAASPEPAPGSGPAAPAGDPAGEDE